MSVIVEVLSHYFPDWSPPTPGRHEWRKTNCPFHGDEHASAAVSFERNAFRCHGCPERGDAYSIVASREGISYREAIERTPEILGRSDSAVPPVATRQPRRRLFGESRAVPEQPRSREVSTRVRRRVFGGA